MGNDLMPAEEMNPKGFFIDLEFDYLMSECFGPIIHPVIGAELPEQIRGRVEDLIRRRELSGSDWGVKQVFGAALFAPLKRICGSVSVVLTKRDLQATRLSLARYTEHDYGTIRALNDWCHRASGWLESRHHPCHSVNFDSLVDFPEEEIEKLAAFVGREPNPSLANFVDPSLRNF